MLRRAGAAGGEVGSSNAVCADSQWLAPLRRRMVRTMAGLDRGIVRRPIALDRVRPALPGGDPSAARE